MYVLVSNISQKKKKDFTTLGSLPDSVVWAILPFKHAKSMITSRCCGVWIFLFGYKGFCPQSCQYCTISSRFDLNGQYTFRNESWLFFYIILVSSSLLQCLFHPREIRYNRTVEDSITEQILDRRQPGWALFSLERVQSILARHWQGKHPDHTPWMILLWFLVLYVRCYRRICGESVC